MPDHLFKPSMHLTKKDLDYFFVEKSDVLKNLTPEELQYVLSCYHLNQTEY